MSKNHQAFSLIEVMLVLALIALIFTLSTAQLTFLHRVSLASELDTLHSVCLMMQQSAMAAGKKMTLHFDPARNRYQWNESSHTLPQYLSFGVLPGVKGPPASPTRPIAHPITFKNNTITFYPDGVISPGTVYIKNATDNYLYALSVSVAQVSYVRLYQYVQSMWVLR